MTTATHQDSQETPEREYIPVRCDNVVWDKYRREHIKCNRLLLRLRAGDEVSGMVEVECARCGRKQWVTLAAMAA